jgi:hypothetical protein
MARPKKTQTDEAAHSGYGVPEEALAPTPLEPAQDEAPKVRKVRLVQDMVYFKGRFYRKGAVLELSPQEVELLVRGGYATEV